MVSVPHLEGIEYLWRVALEAEPKAVGISCIQLLARLYSKLRLPEAEVQTLL